jgi:hypothetical protein
MFNILGLIVSILPAIPNLITAVESLWSGTPKSGPQKWISVEQALSGSIQAVANEVKAAVPNANADEIAAKASIWAKAVNDATVQFFNEAGLLQTTK